MNKLTKRLAAIGAAMTMAVSMMSVNASAYNWSLNYTYGAPANYNNVAECFSTYYPYGTACIRTKCTQLSSNSWVKVSSPDGLYSTVTHHKVTGSASKGLKLVFDTTPNAGTKINHKTMLCTNGYSTYTASGTVYNCYA